MPNSTGSGWYLAGYAAELLVQMRAEREVQDCGRVGHRQGPGKPRLVQGQTTESIQVRLDPARKAKAIAIGGGHVAKGIREALDCYSNDHSALWSLFREQAETSGLSHIETTMLGKVPCVVGPGQKVTANIPERLADEAQRHGFEIVSADFRRGVYVLKVTSLPETASGE
jgi:hypothetical protein